MNKKNIAQAFNKAAKNYDNFSIIQQLAGNILLSKITTVFNISILDAGCGTGWFSRKWKKLGNIVTALDFSKNMLKTAKYLNSAHHYLYADIEELPINDNYFDLSWSNLSLQWCFKLKYAISELCRVTKPGGIVMFSTLADGSLNEMKTAYQAINLNCKINTFLSIQDIQKSCPKKRLLLDNILITFSFSQMLEALFSIKKIGANCLTKNESKMKFLTKKDLIKMKEYWPCNKNGYLLSYKFVFGVIYL